MPSPTSAEIDELLGLNVTDATVTDETEQVEDEGEVAPSGVAEPEETTEEEEVTQDLETTEPGEEVPPEEGEVEETAPVQPAKPSAREARLAQELQRYRKFSPIIDILEESPQLAREVVARRLGLVPQERPAAPAAAAPAEPRLTREQAKEFFLKRLQEDPEGLFTELVERKVAAITQPGVQAGFSSVVRSFKAERMRDEPLFTQYEPYFDVLIRQASPQIVMANPDAALQAVEATAAGAWMRDQRTRASQAKKAAGSLTMPREKPRSLDTSRGNPPAGTRLQAKPQRRLTDEEQRLAERYGIDLVMPDENEEEPENAWR